MACGEFIQFLDSDDLMENNKLEKQVSILNNHLDIFGVYCSTQYFKNAISNIVYTRSAKVQGNIYLKLINGNFIPINSMLTRRSNIIFDESINTCEDWDYWLRVSRSENKFLCMNEKLCYVRIHDNNTSANNEKMIIGKIHVINKLLQITPYMDSLLFKKFKLLYYMNKTEALTYLKYLTSIKNKYLIKGLTFIIIRKLKGFINKILKISRNIYK